MTTEINNWKSAKAARVAAEKWEALKGKQGYGNYPVHFAISLVHCKPPALTRCGQFNSGGQNYWETEKEFNLTIMEWLVKNWGKVAPEVIQMMKDKEGVALKACQEYISEMQTLINTVDDTLETSMQQLGETK
jgi:hypothetical protein